MNIHIEFCEKWNYHPDFDRVSNQIKKYKPDAIIKGNSNPPRRGAFEISINGELVFSKFEKGDFPTIDDIESWF